MKRISTIRLVAAVVLTCLLAMAPSGVAHAHTDLVSSSPREGQRLDGPPTLIELEFSESMDARLSDVSLTIADDLIGPLTVETGTSAGTLIARLDDPGRFRYTDRETSWKVDFRVTSVDGHPVTGSVSFVVAAGGPTDTSESPLTSPTPTDPAPTPTTAPEVSGTDGVPERETASIGSIAVFGGVVLLVVLGALAVSRLRRYDEDEAP